MRDNSYQFKMAPGIDHANRDVFEDIYHLRPSGMDDIFVNKKLLVPEFLPPEDQIVEREQEISTLNKTLRKAALGFSLENTLVYGPKGSGKSLITRHVCRRVRGSAVNDNEIGFAYADCREKRTTSSLVATIARQLNKERETGTAIPETGVSVDGYWQKLASIVNRRHPVIILLLDSIDRIDPEELAPVIRAESRLPVPVGIVAVCDRCEVPPSIQRYQDQSVIQKSIEVEQYDRGQLEEILRVRSAAFDRGVLSEGVLSTILNVDLVTNAHKAITAFRTAGECAVRSGDTEVRPEHVHEAREPIGKRLFYEQVRYAPEHTKIGLAALADLCGKSSDNTFRTVEVYDRYQQLCKERSVDSVSSRHLRELLKSRIINDIINYKKVNHGVAGGVYIDMELCVDPEIVQSVLRDG